MLVMANLTVQAQVIAQSNPIVLTKVSRIGHNNEITIVYDGNKYSLIFKLTKVARGKLIDMNYYDIPSDGRILIKLDDGSILELKRKPGVKETRKYENTVIINAVYTYSSVYDLYEIDDITPLLQHAITKVRVELENSEVEDFEIKKPKEQTRILKEFIGQFRVVNYRFDNQENVNKDLRDGF